jgi:predicted  nucleic acid-binding Zn-ribbon protein
MIFRKQKEIDMSRLVIITSKRGCPVCGGKKWHPIRIEEKTVRDVIFTTVYPKAIPSVMDLPEGFPYDADECHKCGTVVV